ncbi:hypothetical protein D9M73_111460 [compost metagenome]
MPGERRIEIPRLHRLQAGIALSNGQSSRPLTRVDALHDHEIVQRRTCQRLGDGDLQHQIAGEVVLEVGGG